MCMSQLEIMIRQCQLRERVRLTGGSETWQTGAVAVGPLQKPGTLIGSVVGRA